MIDFLDLYGTNDLVWAKVRPDAIIPSKDEENMGRDVYACFEDDYMIIPAHTTMLIPTGVACAMSSRYGIRLRDRGSNGSKGIHVNAGSVDSGYRGEIFVAWGNTNEQDVVLSKLTEGELYERGIDIDNIIYYPYTKAICQAEVVIVPVMEDVEVSYEELQAIPSKRGTGALGSSGK